MVFVAYLFPFLTCLVLKIWWDYEGDWADYAAIVVVGEVVVGLLHRTVKKIYTSDTEFLGSYVENIFHEEPWTEIIHYTETRTDSRGKTYTVPKVRYVYHPDCYYFDTSIGSRIVTDADFYRYVRKVWNVGRQPLSWWSPHIRGGGRFGSKFSYSHVSADDRTRMDKLIPITETHKYTNKIRRSNSIFKFEKISRAKAAELGLYDYPRVEWHDAECILSARHTVDRQVRHNFRKLNAVLGAIGQIRIHILIFDSVQGVGISEYQQAYWEGGNKNEFTVCIGLDDNDKVEWARCFSWADSPELDVAAATWLMDNPNLDWEAFGLWLRSNLYKWKRKEFKDFDYIVVNLPLPQILTVYALSILENALAVYIAIH